MKCKNCEQDIVGKFCNNCGQKTNVRKINFRYILDEIPNSIFQIDRGFFFTIEEMSTRPGHSIREFLEGKRKNYLKPLAFIFLTSTLYVVVNYLIGNFTFMDDFIGGIKDYNRNAIDSDVFDWISNKQTYLIIVLMPFFSLASYLAFIKSKYNYFEHLVLNFYITGQQMLIYLVFSFIYQRDSSLTMIPVVLGFLFNFWTYIQLFEKKSILKKTLLFTLTDLFFIIQVILVMIIVTRVLKFIN